MLIIDALFRFSGIAFLFLLILFAVRDGRTWKSAPYVALASASVTALFLGYAPEAFRLPQPLYGIVRYADIPHLVFVWLFALSLFEDRFQFGLFHIIVGILYCAPIVWLRSYNFGFAPALPSWIFIYGSLTSAALMLHLCYVTLKGRRDDLLESRRASRVYFVIVIVCVAIAAAVIDPMPQDLSPIDKRTAKVLSIWPAIFWGVMWLLALNQRAAHFGQGGGSGRDLDDRDKVLKTKLATLMETDEVFREAGLTIQDLAQRLGVSQHRLRALINQGLGYANFSAFVNAYRIEAVKRALTDAASAHLPVLTIAMDCGFTSLSTFNKAFKAIEGVTPTAYRKGHKT